MSNNSGADSGLCILKDVTRYNNFKQLLGTDAVKIKP